MKRQEKTLGETDPQGCLEAEARRTPECVHPPIAELHRIWCFDCTTASTDEGKVIPCHDEAIEISLNDLDTATIDFRRLAHLDDERKKNLRN